MTENKATAPPEGTGVTDLPPELASTAPMPTQRTVRLRTNLPYQAVRFGAVSLRMMRMVLKSHG